MAITVKDRFLHSWEIIISQNLRKTTCSPGTVQRLGCFTIRVQLADNQGKPSQHECCIFRKYRRRRNWWQSKKSPFLSTAWGKRFGTSINRVRYRAMGKKFCCILLEPQTIDSRGGIVLGCVKHKWKLKVC